MGSTNAVFSCGCWLVAAVRPSFLLYLQHIKCFYVSDSRDLFDFCADGFMRLHGYFSVTDLNCLVWGFWGWGFPCACLPPAASLWISHSAVRLSFVLRKQSACWHRPCSSAFCMLQGSAARCVMRPVLLLSDRNQMGALTLCLRAGTTLVSSVVKRAAAICSPNGTGGKN